MLLVAKANHVVLADKIQMLLDSPARARRLAVAGQAAVIAEFGVGAMVAATADFYHKALGSSPAN